VVTLTHRRLIIDLSAAHRMPTMYWYRGPVVEGGLIGYGPDFNDSVRGTAHYVDRILRGAQPGTLPIQQPTKFELVINLKTAKALGLTIPPSLLLRADHVIE
jgi:putative ABC transport system substrate-binding protein